MNIIEELYYGNISPVEKCFDKNSEYAKFLNIITDNESKLNSYFDDTPDAKKEKQLFLQIMNGWIEVLTFIERERFIEGFQLGARFIHDTFLPFQESIIRDIK